MNLTKRAVSRYLSALFLIIVLVALIVGCSSPASTTAPVKTTAPTTAAPSSTAAPALSTAPPATTAPVTPAAGGIVWKATTMAPKNMFTMRNIQIIADRIGKQSNGQLTINYMGGPEVIPANNQAVAVQQGVIQMTVISMSYYDGIVPVGSMLDLSELTPAEEHTSGAYDFVNEYHKKAGLYYLDRGTAINQSGLQMLILKQPITKPQDLAGKKIGATSNVIDPFMKTIGGTPVIVQTPDVYTALERGVVDGFCYPLTNSADAQLFEVTKYVLDQPFFRGAVGIIVNLDSWNKLPADLQKMLKDITAQVLVEYANDLDGQISKARQTATDKGVKFIKFSDTDAQYFMKTMYDGAWADVVKKLPDSVDKMKALVQKKK